MCFAKASKPPEPKAPPPPPTEREGELQGLADRRRQTAAAQKGGLEGSIKTSALGVTGQAPTFKPTLGA